MESNRDRRAAMNKYQLRKFSRYQMVLLYSMGGLTGLTLGMLLGEAVAVGNFTVVSALQGVLVSIGVAVIAMSIHAHIETKA
jgi:hypothetical protein